MKMQGSGDKIANKLPHSGKMYGNNFLYSQFSISPVRVINFLDDS
jgi:hypothetical protein